MSSGDDDDGWEEATGIFKAVMSSEAQNVGGSQAGSLLVGRRTRSPESDSAAAERTQLFPLKNTITSQVSHWLFLPVHHLF